MIPVPAAADPVREHPPQIGPSSDVGDLARAERLRCALQLLSGAALLAEFDLWIPAAAFAGLRVARTGDGLRVLLGRWPVPLSPVINRMGGGEGATEALRAAVVDRVTGSLGLGGPDVEREDAYPGFSLDGPLAHLIEALDQRLDPATARALWAFRWRGLPFPDEGTTQLWHVPRPSSARRLAGALWCDLARAGRRARICNAGEIDSAESALGPCDSGTVIVTGEVSDAAFARLNRWTWREGRSAVAVGTFPEGWAAPYPVFDSAHLDRHLAVVGLPRDRARRIVDQRRSSFRPLEKSDRAALTNAILARLDGSDRDSRRRSRDAAETALREWLSLSPSGLSPAMISLHSGVDACDLEDAASAVGVIQSADSWRFPESPSLTSDPRHLVVARALRPSDPCRHVHEALGFGESEQLEAWARNALDQLQGLEVRRALANVRAGALGPEIERLRAEACLSVLDIAAARRVLSGLADDSTDPLALWLEALDHAPGRPRRLPSAGGVQRSPRAAAEAAAIILRDARRRGTGSEAEALEVAELALERLGGGVARRVAIDIAFALEPERLLDRRRRRKLAGRSAILRAQLAHRTAMLHLDRGHTRAARRLLEAIATDALGPGLLGVIELDLGAVALEDGRSRDAVGHHLRAYRLLENAGFEHLTRLAVFNLAVADIDHLLVRSAEQRLEKLWNAEPDDPFVVGERARLLLASGHEGLFRNELANLEAQVEPDDPRFSAGLALLRGVAALLDGEHDRAAVELDRAGEEGLAWKALTETDRGGGVRIDEQDSWGVSGAAVLLDAARNNRGAIPSELRRAGTPAEALGFALAERLHGTRLSADATFRNKAIGTLRSAGLTGWAEVLSGAREGSGGLLAALARIIDTGGMEGVETRHLDTLIQSLRLTGLEIHDGLTGELIWARGQGSPGSEHPRGRLVAVPLGDDLENGVASRLVLGVLDLVLRSAGGAGDIDEGETGFLGRTDAARSLRRELRLLGPSHLPVLLSGETGVGKEVAARALHRLSRRPGPLVPVNIAAIPAGLLEAELFGSVKGAFTGADRSRTGLAAAADGGTLFLDEVGDLEPDLQVKLLRFLESGEVRPVGSSATRQVDVRIVSATHTDLAQRMREGRFRRDLYFRIAAPEVHIPPLRSRIDDLVLLREYFQREAASHHGLREPGWSAEADKALRSYHWPGNVRELRQVVEVAMVRAAGSVVRREHLPIESSDPPPSGTWEQAQREFRYRFLKAALRRNDGNRSATARELGISRQALLYHLRKLGISDI